MPIKPGYSYSRVQENIRQLITEGYKREQAIAIAFSVARKTFWMRHPEGALPEWLTPIGGKRLKNPVKKVYSVSDIPESQIKDFVFELLDAYKTGGMNAARKIAVDIASKNKMTMGESAAMSNYFYMGKKEIDNAGMTQAIKRDAAVKNPVPLSRRAKVEHAAKLYENFSGHDAEEIISIDKPDMPDVMLRVGEIDGVMYSTVRDGVPEKYIHKFNKSCRPIFAVSHDGKQLFMLGGAYDFTERGIVDHSKGD